MDTDNLIALCIPVEIGFTVEGWFSLRLPMLLPKKAEGSADYIRSFLYPAMREFFMEKEPVRFKDCVLIYRHVYDRFRPERQKRDHDNIEINKMCIRDRNTVDFPLRGNPTIPQCSIYINSMFFIYLRKSLL